MSHAFVRLPTSESTTFEQQVCSAKIGYANTILLGTNSRKKGMWTLRTAQIKQKKQCNFDRGWFERQELNQFHCYNLNRVFFPKDGPESFQVQDWYSNEKMVVVSVCLNVPCFDVGCCSSECMRVVSHLQR